MVSAVDYALLSLRVYSKSNEKLRGPVPSGWTLLVDRPDDLTGFSAGAYRNTATGEIVIAYTGLRYRWLALCCITLLVLTACGPTREWDEEVKLSNGQIISVHRKQHWSKSHPIGEGVGYGYEDSSLDVVSKIPSLPAFPTWRGKAELPMVFDVDERSGDYLLVTALPICWKYYELGKPSPPYLEYRVKNGKWERSAWTGVAIGKHSNVMVFVDPREVEKSFSWKEVFNRNLKSPIQYRAVQDIQGNPGC